MKKIALISDGWKRLVTYSWVDGIMGNAKGLGEEICLHQFNTNGNWSHDKKYNDGEYKLYTLPNWEAYDGVIFDGTNITDQETIRSIVEVLKTLSLEANAVALNGAFSRLFDIICRAGKRSKGDFRRVNPKLEKMIIDTYHKILFGERPIVIDEDVYRDAPIITRLNRHLKKVYNKRNLTDQQLIDEIIQPFADILFTDFSVIDVNEFDI